MAAYYLCRAAVPIACDNKPDTPELAGGITVIRTKNPYTLYSASNLGSILALVSYPTIVEPLFDLRQQGYIWWAGYLVVILLCIKCMPRGVRENPGKEEVDTAEKVTFLSRIKWFLLSAAGCVALLAVTNLITFDLASVPFLWVLPLIVYLATFVLAFKNKSWYPAWIKSLLEWVIPVGIMLYIMSLLHFSLPILAFIPFHLGILFVVCLNCHGRLVELKPLNLKNLTDFYLMIALGGFVGSLLVSTIIPVITKSLLEYPILFFLAALALMVSGTHGREKRITRDLTFLVYIFITVAALTGVPIVLSRLPGDLTKAAISVIAVPVFFSLRWASGKPKPLVFLLLVITFFSQWTEDLFFRSQKAVRHRNFYGVYRVYDDKEQRYLQHGTTLHGRQYLEGPKIYMPLAYFHPSTPIGEFLWTYGKQYKDIGMIGLGTGALAVYMGKGQKFTIYELDPDNLDIAERYFSYLDIAREKGAELEFVFGDGRISLKSVPDDSYDILIIDAFNSGSIPVHLLTVEALREYFRVLKPKGILLMHISNKMLDLAPVIYHAARTIGVYTCDKSNAEYVHPDADLSLWVACTPDEFMFNELVKNNRWTFNEEESKSDERPWTDRYTNLLSTLF